MNDDFTINGKKGAFQQPRRYGLNESGFYQVIPFEGTMQEVKNRAAAYGAIGAYYEVEELYGGRARLSVYLSWANTNQLGAEVPINLWEMDPQEVEKDLLEADFPNSNVITGANTLTSNDRKVLSALMENPSFTWDGVDTSITPGDVPLTVNNVNAVYTLYLLMKAGVRAFPVDSHVIRHTQVVSNRYATQVSFLNSGKILSRASFIALEGVPSDLLFSVPTAPTALQFIQFTNDLAYGWRKLKPAVQDIALQKRQIVNTYVFGLWALTLYGPVI